MSTFLPNLTSGAGVTLTASPARTPAFFMASLDMPTVRHPSRTEASPADPPRAEASTSATMATVATVFFPLLPLIETVSPSKTPNSSMAPSVMPTTECPPPLSSSEYRYTFMVLRLDAPPSIASDRSTSFPPFAAAAAALDVGATACFFAALFFLEEEDFFLLFFFLEGDLGSVEPPLGTLIAVVQPAPAPAKARPDGPEIPNAFPPAVVAAAVDEARTTAAAAVAAAANAFVLVVPILRSPFFFCDNSLRSEGNSFSGRS
mmetsp:Transcript_43324/g.80548  ORF Transcript_43324/g.80548 Transcript_43324/m.80548 type:complete len:261 (+) Transcript_43324:1162-1944(+)